MKIQVISDIHLEFYTNKNPISDLYESNREFIQAPYLFLLGDIGNPIKYPSKWMNFISWATSNYKKVFYVMGNHESYYNTIKNTIEFIKKHFEQYENIVFLESGVVHDLEDYKVIGCTLWTDIDFSTALLMNDMRNINADDNKMDNKLDNYNGKYNERPISIDTLQKLYNDDKTWLETALPEIRKLEGTRDGNPDSESDSNLEKKKTKVIVATHHMPSMQLIHSKFRDPRNMKYARGFASNLDHLLSYADYWLFGHTHIHIDTIINDVRCYCNPMGYPGEETDFKIECLDL